MASAMSSSDTSTRLAASPSGTNESRAATRAIGPVNPPSTSAGDDRLADAALCAGSRRRRATRPTSRGVAQQVVDRQRREPAQVEHAAADAFAAPAARRRAATGTARWPTSRQHVVAVAGDPSAADRDVRSPSRTVDVRRQPPAVAGRRAGRGCGRARSARGTRTRVPSVFAAAAHVRSIAAASSAGPARRHEPGDVAQHRRARCRCGSARRSPSGSRSRRRARPSGCGTGRSRRTTASPPRRGAGPWRCAGRRGTGSPGSAAARTRRARARGRGSSARRAACRTRGARRPRAAGRG